MTRQELKACAKQQIKGKIGILFLIELIVGGISSLLSFVPVVGSIASLICAPALSFSIILVYYKMSASEYTPEVGDVFVGFNNLTGVLRVYFANLLFTFLWMLLFYIPGFVKAIAYSQAFYILAENPEIGGREAIKRSSDMMQGHKMEYFVLQLSFTGWIILSLLTCGILLIWVGPYMNATLANFYQSIKPADEQIPVNDMQFN